MNRRKSLTAFKLAASAILLALASNALAEGESSALRRALDPVVTLIEEGRWQECADKLDSTLKEAPQDHNLHLRRGKCALGLMDLTTATRHFSRALSLAPTLEKEVGASWHEAGLTALEGGEADRAVAMFAKAFSHNRELGPSLGRLTIETAQKLDDEARRASYMTRAVAWSGPGPVLEAGIAYYSRAFGPPRKVYLDNPGWAPLARLRPGDRILYLSEQPFKQRDAATMRILPAAVTNPMALTLEERDTGGGTDTEVQLGRHNLPARIYLWLIPSGD